MNRVLLASVLTLACACTTTTTTTSPSDPTPPPAATTPEPEDPPAPDPDLKPELIKQRPYDSKAPSGYDGSKALPLVLALHGRGDTGPAFVKGMRLAEIAEDQEVLLAYPTGQTVLGASGWGAMTGVAGAPDDVTYLRAVIADMASRFKVDKKRVVVVGLSMGGFMANLLACRAADKIAGILSMAGSLVVSESKSCTPDRPLSVTLIHGTADDTVSYDGGALPIGDGTYLSAPKLYEHWAGKAGCGAETTLPARDLDATLAGAETTGVTRTCEGGTTVTFLTAKGGAHVLSMTKTTIASLVAATLEKPRAD